MDTTLVIMAAGIGSRYGDKVKQIEPVGPNGEIIMEYSIYNAIKAGFNKVVFILREDILEYFKNNYGSKFEKKITCKYVIQSLDDIPDKYKSNNRYKPWGTGHAIIAAISNINEPFCVINADDYYGETGFKLIYEFLVNNNNDNEHCMVGFNLKNTLSKNGGVSRGICYTDSLNYLKEVIENHNVKKEGDIITSNYGIIDIDSKVSMNMWGFKPSILNKFVEEFDMFLNKYSNDLNKEYLIPSVVDKLIKSGDIKVKLLETDDKWFGVTYKEDYDEVVKKINKLHLTGKYEDI